MALWYVSKVEMPYASCWPSVCLNPMFSVQLSSPILERNLSQGHIFVYQVAHGRTFHSIHVLHLSGYQDIVPHTLFTVLLEPVDTFSHFNLTGPQSLVLCFCVHQVAITRDALRRSVLSRHRQASVPEGCRFPTSVHCRSELVTARHPSSIQPLLANP